MHAYWKADDAQMKQIDMINFTEEHDTFGGACDALAATASVADESGDRVAAHSMWEGMGHTSCYGNTIKNCAGDQVRAAVSVQSKQSARTTGTLP
jgi:hypothetical protein